MRTLIGVIIGRFQTPVLHQGHRYLIDHVAKRHEQILILIGCSPLPLTIRNPLDFESRKQMIAEAYPDAVIAALEDTKSDETWSANLDNTIAKYFPDHPAQLYGSRDCFFSGYSGKYECITVPELVDSRTATQLREAVSVINSNDFRSGIIHASRQRFPTSYQVADVAVINPRTKEVLLGQKPEDGNKFRFIGGFVDPKDESLERAAKREVFEETSGLETADYFYLGSHRIPDWRYRGSEDGIMSAFFVAQYIFGHPKAADDLTALSWHPLSQVEELIADNHLPLAKLLNKYIAQHGI
jgi:bifunctional NMN adenylyltransferase/nudix hydrolase